MNPFHLAFSITQECPFRCDICLRYYDPHSRALKPAQWERMVQILKPLGLKRLTVTGGEPVMLGDRLFDFLEYLHREQIHTSLSTTGFHLDNARVLEMDSYLDHILLSMPALDLDDYLVALGKVPQARESYRTAKNLMAWVKNTGIILEVATVVHRENKEKIMEFGEKLLAANPDIVWRINAYYSNGIRLVSQDRFDLENQEFDDLCQSVQERFADQFRGIRCISKRLQETAPGYLLAQNGSLLLTASHRHIVTGYNVLMNKLPRDFPMPRSWNEYRMISRDWRWGDFLES